MYLIAIAIGLIMLLILWSQIELRILSTTEYTLSSDKLGKDFNPVTFVVLADLHNHSIGKGNKKLIDKIDLIRPDFILIAGDLVTKRQFCIPSNAFSLLKSLSKKYTIYYGYGNHEQYFKQLLDGLEDKHLIETEIYTRKCLYKTWVEYKKRLTDLGIVFLDNEGVTFTDRKNTCKLFLNSLTIDMSYYLRSTAKAMENHPDGSTQTKLIPIKEYMDNLIGESFEDGFNLLIAHNPIFFGEYIKWGADLTLSGHVHGGLVRLPFIGGLVSPQVSFLPKYDAGRFTKDEKDMIISRGLGTHSYMLRIFNPPELVVVHLENK